MRCDRNSVWSRRLVRAVDAVAAADVGPTLQPVVGALGRRLRRQQAQRVPAAARVVAAGEAAVADAQSKGQRRLQGPMRAAAAGAEAAAVRMQRWRR